MVKSKQFDTTADPASSHESQLTAEFVAYVEAVASAAQRSSTMEAVKELHALLAEIRDSAAPFQAPADMSNTLAAINISIRDVRAAIPAEAELRSGITQDRDASLAQFAGQLTTKLEGIKAVLSSDAANTVRVLAQETATLQRELSAIKQDIGELENKGTSASAQIVAKIAAVEQKLDALSHLAQERFSKVDGRVGSVHRILQESVTIQRKYVCWIVALSLSFWGALLLGLAVTVWKLK